MSIVSGLASVLLAMSAASAFAPAGAPIAADGEDAAQALAGFQWAPPSGLVRAAASPDEQLFVAALNDGTVRQWDLRTGIELARARLDGVQAIAQRADGSLFAAASARTVVVFDRSGRERARRDWSTRPRLLAFSPNAETLLVVSSDVQLWRLDDGSAPRPLAVRSTMPVAVALSPDGKLAAFGMEDGAIALVSLEDGSETKRLEGHEGAVTALEFSSRGDALVSGSDDSTVRLWNTANGQQRLKVPAHAMSVTAVRLSKDGRVLASASRDGTARLWDAQTGREWRRVSIAADTTGVALSADTGRLYAWSPSAVQSAFLVSNRVENTLTLQSPAVDAIATLQDSFVAGSADGVLRIVSAQTGEEQQRVQLPAAVQALELDASRTLLAAASADRRVRVWEIASGQERKNVELPALIRAIAFPASGSLRAAAADGQSLVVFSEDDNWAPRRIDAHDTDVVAVALSGDGRLAATAGSDGSVKLWNLESPADVKHLAGRGETVTRLRFSPSGRWLAAGGERGSVRLWDVAAATQRWSLNLGEKAVSSLAFAADESRLAVGSDVLRVVPLPSGAPAVTVSSGRTSAVAFDAAGDRLLVGSPDGRLEARAPTAGSALAFVAWHGRSGTWMTSANGRLRRHDDGRLLRRAGGDGIALVPSQPAAPPMPPQLTMEVTERQPPIDAGALGRLVAKVRNDAAGGPAYWLDLRATSTDPSFRVIEPARIALLAPGESVDIVVLVGASSLSAPQPRSLPVTLKLSHAFGEGATLSSTVPVKAPSLTFGQPALEGALLRFDVQNAGNEGSDSVELKVDFMLNGQRIATAPTLRLAPLSPGATSRVSVEVPEQARTLEDWQVRIVTSSERWLGHTWQGELKPDIHRSAWQLWAALGGLLVVVLLSVALFVRFHPIVRRVSREPSALRQYEWHRYPAVERALKRAMRLDAVLDAASVPSHRWKRLLDASNGAPHDVARAFAEAVGAKLGSTLISDQLWSVTLPPLRLRFPERDVPFAIFAGQSFTADDATQLVARLQRDGESPTAALVIDLTTSQTVREVLAELPRIAFVVLGSDDLRDVLLADEAVLTLTEIISAQRPRSDISPYRTAGGLEEDPLFFGRERELRLIADRGLANFLVVGPRQAGKSSLMKAVRRRLEARGDLDVHHFTLANPDLAGIMARHLGQPKPADVDEFYNLAAGTRQRPKVWLIDEADDFILADSRDRYPYSQAMRTLAEEGRSYFILAGFWHLYAAALLNPNNPLRNFGEVVRMGPLDKQAARDLAVKPMSALGVGYSSPEMVDRLISETGCRAHLIVITCKAMIEQLSADERTLEPKHLDRALRQNPQLFDELKIWRREPLGRALVHAALLDSPPTRAELRKRLEDADIHAATELVASTLDRLELAYVLVQDDKGRFICPIPILREFILQEGDPRDGLARDAKEFNAAVKTRTA